MPDAPALPASRLPSLGCKSPLPLRRRPSGRAGGGGPPAGGRAAGRPAGPVPTRSRRPTVTLARRASHVVRTSHACPSRPGCRAAARGLGSRPPPGGQADTHAQADARPWQPLKYNAPRPLKGATWPNGKMSASLATGESEGEAIKHWRPFQSGSKQTHNFGKYLKASRVRDPARPHATTEILICYVRTYLQSTIHEKRKLIFSAYLTVCKTTPIAESERRLFAVSIR
jgi:hypothetical protein